MIALPQIRGPEKPKYGDACNGCGACCAAEVCWIGKAVLQNEHADGPFPLLEFVESEARFYCGLVRNARRYIGTPEVADCIGKTAKLFLGIGRGCDSEFKWEV